MTGGGWGGGGCEVPGAGFRCCLGERGSCLVAVGEGGGGVGSDDAGVGGEWDGMDWWEDNGIAGMGALIAVVVGRCGRFAADGDARRGEGVAFAGSHDGSSDEGIGARAASVKSGRGPVGGACRL